MFFRKLGCLHDGRELWNPHPAMTRVVQIDPGPTPLSPRRPRFDQVQRALSGGHIAPDELTIRKVFFRIPDSIQYVPGMTVCRINRQNIHTRLDQCLGSRLPVLSRADGSSRPKPAKGIFAGIGVLSYFLNILNGDEPLQIIMFVHDQ